MAESADTDNDIERENAKLQYQIERLKKIDEQNRIRSSRYLNKHYEQGRKQISALISQEAFDTIQLIKAESIESGTPLTASDIIDSAILAMKRDKAIYGNSNGNIIIETEQIKDIPLPPETLSPPPVEDTAEEDIPEIESMLNHAKGLWNGEGKENQEYRIYLNEMIFNLHTKHSLSARKIKALLESHGIKTAKGYDTWQAGTLGNIIRDKKRLNSDGE